MFKQSIKLGTIAGIRIGIHYTWFIIFLLIVYSLTSVFQVTYSDWSKTTAVMTAVTTSVLFFVSIVLHELGHSFVAIARGIPVKSITLFIFGGVAQTEQDADSAATEFWIAIAGPAVSIALSIFFYVAVSIVEPVSVPAAAACRWLAQINLAVGVFNLLPGFPLDGGRVFRAIVWGASGDARLGMRWAFVAGKFVAHGMILLGLLIIFTTGFIFNGLWLAAIGWFLLTAVEASNVNFTMRHVLDGVTAADVMEPDAPQVPTSLTINRWINEQVLTQGTRAALVMDRDRVVGIVTMNDTRKLPREEWSSRLVSDVMTLKDELRTVTINTPVLEVLRLMQEAGFNQVPVKVDGQIEGWIDRTRLLQLIQLHIETGR